VVASQHLFYASPDHRAEHGRREAHLAVEAQAQDPIPCMVGQELMKGLRPPILTIRLLLRRGMCCKAG